MPDPTPEADAPSPLESLSPAERAVLEAILAGRWAWIAQIYLVAAGHDPAVIASMVGRKILDLWDLTPETVRTCLKKRHSDEKPRPSCRPLKSLPPEGWCVTLTPRWADLLGVEVVEVGPAERPKWGIKQPEEEKRPIVAFQFEVKLKMLEQVPDPKSIVKATDVMKDEYSGEPVKLYEKNAHGQDTGGIPIVIDRRMKGKK